MTTYSKLALGYIDEARGVFVQEYGVVDLGSLTWGYWSNSKRFSAFISDSAKTTSDSQTASLLSTIYTAVSNVYFDQNTDVDLTIRGSSNGTIYVRNLEYTDADTFKTAMSGVYLIYELATPVETDISDILEDCGIETNAYGQVCRGGEGGGTVVITTNTGLAVPSDDTFLIKTV